MGHSLKHNLFATLITCITKMEKLFYFILVLTLINFSTQFFFDSETEEFDAEPYPTPNPVVKRCGEKLLNNTETTDCIKMANKHWFPNTTEIHATTESPKTNHTVCCLMWDVIHCYLKIYEKVCTQEEVKEANDFLKVDLNYLESNQCKSWPFKEAQKLCHSK